MCARWMVIGHTLAFGLMAVTNGAIRLCIR
jgi:hypothetical protein